MRMGIWYSCTGYVSIFSPLINYGLGSINGGKDTWRYMYYFAGGLTMFWGIVIFFVLPPDPVRAKGFDERERYIMVARLRSNNSGVRNTHFKGKQILELILDIKFWLMFATAFLCMVPNGMLSQAPKRYQEPFLISTTGPISAFIPIIVKGFGFSSLNSILLLMPVGAYAGTMQLLLPFFAAKYPNIRSYLVFGALMGTTLSAVLLWKLPLKELGGLLFATIILPSVGAGYAVMMGLQIANIAGYTKKTVASSGLYIGYCLGKHLLA
jgi:MFS family permease